MTEVVCVCSPSTVTTAKGSGNPRDAAESAACSCTRASGGGGSGVGDLLKRSRLYSPSAASTVYRVQLADVSIYRQTSPAHL